MPDFGGLMGMVADRFGDDAASAVNSQLAYAYANSQCGEDNGPSAVDAMQSVLDFKDNYVGYVDEIIASRQMEILRNMEQIFNEEFRNRMYRGNSIYGELVGRARFWEGRIRLGNALRMQGFGRGMKGRGLFAEEEGYAERRVGMRLVQAAEKRALFWSRVEKGVTRVARFIK